MQLLNTALLNTAALLNPAPMKKVVLYGVCWALVLTLPGNILAQDGAEPSQLATTTAPGQPAPAATSLAGEVALSNLPDSPGAEWAKAQQTSPQQTSTSQAQTPPSTQTGSSQTGVSQNGASQNGASQNGTSQDAVTPNQSQKPQRP